MRRGITGALLNPIAPSQMHSPLEAFFPAGTPPPRVGENKTQFFNIHSPPVKLKKRAHYYFYFFAGAIYPINRSQDRVIKTISSIRDRRFSRLSHRDYL
jgi:hypothetical protein